MDPASALGAVLTALQLCTSVLNIGNKVHGELFGDDKSVDKLRQLNGRLQILAKVFENIVEQTRDSEHGVVEQFHGTHTLEKTLDECKVFLNNYQKALSESGRRSTLQRAKFIVGSDETRLERYNKRIDQHYLELQEWRSGVLSKKIDEVIARTHNTPSSTTSHEKSHYSTPPSHLLDRRPQRTLTGDTLLPSSPRLSPDSPGIQSVSRTPSLASIPESPLSVILPSGVRSRKASQQSRDHGGQVVSPAHLLLTPGTDPANWGYASAIDSTTVSRTSSEVRSREDVFGQISPHIYPGPPSVTGMEAPFASPLSDSHSAILVLGKRKWTFKAASCAISDVKGVQVLVWANNTTKLSHYVPTPVSKIPHTRPSNPGDTRFEVSFLPSSYKHIFEIIEHGVTEEVHEKPRYQFVYKTDRDAFQQKFRGHQFLEMVQARSIRAQSGIIAQVVHLKVWSRNESDEEPTFSFARHGAKESNHQEEYKIRWFRKTPELRDTAKLVLGFYSPNADLEYGKPPETPSRKASMIENFGNMMRRQSGSSSKSRSPSISTTPQVLYDRTTKGIIPNADVQHIAYLEIEFASPKLRDAFINACYEADRRSVLSKRNTAISDGLPSPQVSSRPASLLNVPFERSPISESLRGMHESPTFNVPRYAPTQLQDLSHYSLSEPSLDSAQDVRVATLD
ncbi:hypothetical protein BKA67DRAFT_655378 [Truncatella angustata]|uniref:Fungal N-terminal domain-containing protein n=1 Tax=Truncatella angustata TaxID=152316 RepID=A0A9P8URF2_9PEZI|nr:uncharacterized protein BKA67DRAFT_655378 [Truncatella angustata]KAH6657087.1 hypothetical protein BKA67DRAFT_655378 [Truncatella angustata]